MGLIRRSVRCSTGKVLRRAVVGTLVAALLGGLLATGVQAQNAEAISGSQFDPGNIISDQYFYDSNAMSEGAIQSFLSSSVGNCGNANCLAVLRLATPAKPEKRTGANALICRAYAGTGGESAASIIFKVQQACGISAKVILVTLQKEQGLITKSAPSAGVLERAMGYGCPDHSGGTCASEYYGFFNQVYWAAWQLKRYGTNVPFGTYQPGVRSIQYHPNAGCGTVAVNIKNNATAALYNYTPYVPNGAALANLGGTGDSCSSYGNRNFWVYYTNWFGSTTHAPGTPEGSVTDVSTSYKGVTVSGWAVDPDSVSSAVTLSIQLGSTWQVLYANQAGEDLSAKYPGAGRNHAFSGTLPIGAGDYSMCVYPVNAGGVGSTGSLGCTTVNVPSSPPPVGQIETATSAAQSISFTGWAVRPDALASPVSAAVNIGPNWYAFNTGAPSAAAPGSVPGAGPNQGLGGTFPAAPGLQSFCLWASPTTGPAVSVGCRTVVVPQPQLSVSKIETVAATSSGITIAGWSVWPTAKDRPVDIAINVGSSWFGTSANKQSANAAAAVGGAGPNHGFSLSLPLPAGSYNVCVWAAELGSPATQVGCQPATVGPAPASAIGAIESVTGAPAKIDVTGWATWPSSPNTSVRVAVNIGSKWYALSANQPSTAAAAALPSGGPNHGYSGSFPAAPGTYSVCVWVAQSSGASSQQGCRTATVAAALASVGEVLDASSGVGGVHVDGWVVLPETPSAAVPVAAEIDGIWVAMGSGKPNVVAPTKFSGAGPNQGFSGLFETGLGSKTICVWASGSMTTGPVNLGCRTVVVQPAPESVGIVTSGVGVPGGANMEGWAVWPSQKSSPVPIAANVGSTWVALANGKASTTAPDYVAGVGPNQGFSGTISAPSGQQSVCIWVAQPVSPAKMIGCKTVRVP